ncbi:TPA: Bro-N domain-containing protein [Citrobacter freundii]
MPSKNSEAQQCANTNRASIEKSCTGNIDMNIVAKSDYNFQGIDLVPAPVNGGIWLTSSDIAKALGYASSKSVSTIYSRNSDEFTSSMSMVIKMMTNGINNNLREKSVRVFSLRGCHLIAMFATTDKAKEFRRWVLDILDREVVTGNISPTFDFEMHAKNALVAEEHFKYVYMVWKESIRPALRCTGSPLAVSLEDRFKAISAITFGLSCALSKQEKNWGIH